MLRIMSRPFSGLVPARMPHQARKPSAQRRSRRLWALEGLEGRLLLSGNPTIYTVNAITDTGAGSGTTGDLLYCINQANANTNTAGSEIQFDPTVFGSPQTITLSSTLALTETAGPEVINGPGANLVTVSGNYSVGVLSVSSGVTATLSGLTISNGSAGGAGIDNSGTLTVTGSTIDDNHSGFYGNGGGIYNAGRMTLADSTVASNFVAPYGAGGGLYNAGTMTITNSTVAGNGVDGYGAGGGLYNAGQTTVTDSTFAGNWGRFTGGIGSGSSSGATLTLTDSTIVNNSAEAGAGGLGIAGTAVIANCTIAGNFAPLGGGGLTVGYGCTVTITNSTIVDNKVIIGMSGGGLNFVNSGTVVLYNTIVALNTNYCGTPTDISLEPEWGWVGGGTVSSTSAYNLIGTGGSGGLVNGVNGNQVGVANPGLDPNGLQNNGGPTQTIALLPGSPAIDKGSNALAIDPTTGQPLAYDQRGPGYPRIVNGPVDIGAFEVQATNHLAVTAQPPSGVTAGSGFGFTVTAEDKSGNVLSSFNGTVTVALANNPSGATLGGPLTATAQSGVASFSGLTLNKAASGYTLLVTASGLGGAFTNAFQVTPAAATQLVVTTQPPSELFVGNRFGLVVSAEDPYGNVDPNFGRSVAVALLNNPGGATLGGTLSETAQSGVAAFSDLTLDQPGTGYTLQVSSRGLTGATTGAFNVESNLLVNGDFSQGNTGFTSQYVYSTTLSPEGTYVVGDNPHHYNPGGASFGDHTTGTGLMLIANGSPTPNTVVWQETINVSTATDYVFSGWAASVGMGGGGGGPTDPSPARLEFFVNGVQIGSEFTVIAQDGDWSQFSAPWTSGTSGVVTVSIIDMNTDRSGNDFCLDDLAFGASQAVYPRLMVTAQPPASVTAGSGFGLTVTAYDKSGHVDSSFNGTVTAALENNPGGATLGGTLTATAQDGVASFSGLTLDTSANGYTLLVSANGLASATTSPFNVTAAAATQLVVTTQPSGSVTAGSGFGLVISAEDNAGHVATTFSGSVTVALWNNPGSATLGGTLIATAQSGVATFSGLTLDQPGTGYTLQVSTSGMTAATTSAFNVQTTIAAAGVCWGTQTAALQTASDGVRLLPAGRNTDLPWLGINQFAITLAQATTLAAGDGTVSSAIGANYGPVTISGSGTRYTITLAQPINKADRVTITIGNATIATYTRRLDVLPGDVNDNGVVNLQDVLLVRNEAEGITPATIFGDINGDGVVNLTDYNLVRALLGSTLPPVGGWQFWHWCRRWRSGRGADRHGWAIAGRRSGLARCGGSMAPPG
jgi:hypothetical protein